MKGSSMKTMSLYMIMLTGRLMIHVYVLCHTISGRRCQAQITSAHGVSQDNRLKILVFQGTRNRLKTCQGCSVLANLRLSAQGTENMRAQQRCKVHSDPDLHPLSLRMNGVFLGLFNFKSASGSAASFQCCRRFSGYCLF